MGRSDYIEMIQSVLATENILRSEETLTDLYRIIYTYSNTILRDLKSHFNHLCLVLSTSYENISFQHQQIQKILNVLQDKLIFTENIMNRSTTNFICVKYQLPRDVSRELCKQLLVLTQGAISFKITKFLSDKRAGSMISSVKKGLVRSQHDLLTEIAQHI